MRRSLALVLAVGLLACDEEAPVADYTRSTVPAPSDAEIGARAVATPADAFVYASDVTVLAAHPPTRFEARLPTHHVGDGTLGELPFAYYEARLCAGDEAMRTRALEVIDRIAASEPVDEWLLDTYSELLGRCPSTKHCAWLAALARTDRVYWAKIPLTGSLVWCEDPGVHDVMLGPDVPARATVIWMRNNVPAVGDQVPPALERAVRQLIVDNHEEAYVDAAVALVRYRGPHAATLLAELQVASDRVTEGVVDDYGDAVEAPSLLTHACEYLLVAPQCADLPGYREIDEVDLIVAGSADQYAQAMLEPKRAAKAGEPLAACVRDTEQVEARRAHCLARVAAIDWPLAKKVAEQVSTYDPMFAEGLRIVSAFDSHEAFRAELRAIELIGDEVQPTFRESLSVGDELLRARRLHMFSPRSGAVPVRHDILLFQLAALAGDAMIDVVFEELPPSDIDEMYSSAPHVLRAYADGKRWSVVADAIDDHYEVRQTIGLLNVVAAERGSELRWVALRDDEQFSVIVAPREAIRVAVDRGYIELADF